MGGDDRRKLIAERDRYRRGVRALYGVEPAVLREVYHRPIAGLYRTLELGARRRGNVWR